MWHERAVFAAEILALIGRSATMSRLGSASSTTWPRLPHSFAARCTASRHSGCNSAPRWSFSMRAIRSLRGGRATASRKNVGYRIDFVEKLGLSLGVDHDSPWLGTGSGDPR